MDLATAPESCVDTCSTYVGEVGSTSVCMSTPYSADRLLSPFPQDATSVDWRDKYVVQAIQNQGTGSCDVDWAFAASAAAESAYAIKTGTLYKISEQYLIDCDSTNSGCLGGKSSRALAYLEAN